MVDLFGVDTNLWTAGAAAAQTIIVAAAAGVAYRQVQEARLTREDQARPFVIIDFDMSEPPLMRSWLLACSQAAAAPPPTAAPAPAMNWTTGPQSVATMPPGRVSIAGVYRPAGTLTARLAPSPTTTGSTASGRDPAPEHGGYGPCPLEPSSWVMIPWASWDHCQAPGLGLSRHRSRIPSRRLTARVVCSAR
jgi:predicted component of type VI protein secretion system